MPINFKYFVDSYGFSGIFTIFNTAQLRIEPCPSQDFGFCAE